MLTDNQKLVCERVINVFETGTIEGKYGAISIYHDGPHQIRQITYGKSQTTEYGNLQELVEMYAQSGGTFSAALAPYVDRIGVTALTDNAEFKDLLRRAGNEDPVMRSTQDAFFDKRYFNPALKWATDHGFVRALSVLVIYDSFIHSGGILSFLRSRFTEKPPAAGGNEETWIRQYVNVRHDWLSTHSNPDVRPSAYRTRDLKREIEKGNWDLAMFPFVANGTSIPDPSTTAPVLLSGAALDVVPYVGPELDDEAVFSEIEPLSAPVSAAPPTTAATLAQQILNDGRIDLATSHVSGVADNATARQNISDTANGQEASRSSYGTAPGGTVALDVRMLQALVTLSQTYTFAISEICGGSHNATSRHYAGIGFDVNRINGQPVSANHPDQAAFQAACRHLGASEVLGPGQQGHSTHVHAAWPRP